MSISEYREDLFDENPFSEQQTAIVKLGLTFVFCSVFVIGRLLRGPVFDSSWTVFQEHAWFWPVISIFAIFGVLVFISAVMSVFMFVKPEHDLFNDYTVTTQRIIAVRGLLQPLLFVCVAWFLGIWDMLVTVNVSIGLA